MYIAKSCCSGEYFGFLPPVRAQIKILGVLSSSVVYAIAHDLSLPKSQTPLTQIIVLLGRCPEL